MLQRLLARARSLWVLAKTERASPREIGWAIFVGVVSGCTPAVGFHGWLALGLATLFRLNRLFAFLGSRVSNLLILPFIIWSEIELAHLLRTGATVPLDRHRALEEAPLLMLDWSLGSLLVGPLLGALLGALAYALARTRPHPTSTRETTPVTVSQTPSCASTLDEPHEERYPSKPRFPA